MIRRAVPRLLVVVEPEDEAIGYALDGAAWTRYWASLTPAEQDVATRAARAAVDAATPDADRGEE